MELTQYSGEEGQSLLIEEAFPVELVKAEGHFPTFYLLVKIRSRDLGYTKVQLREAFKAWVTDKELDDSAGNATDISVAAGFIIDVITQDVKRLSKVAKALMSLVGKPKGKMYRVAGYDSTVAVEDVQDHLEVVMLRLANHGKMLNEERKAQGSKAVAELPAAIGEATAQEYQKMVGEAIAVGRKIEVDKRSIIDV